MIVATNPFFRALLAMRQMVAHTAHEPVATINAIAIGTLLGRHLPPQVSDEFPGPFRKLLLAIAHDVTGTNDSGVGTADDVGDNSKR